MRGRRWSRIGLLALIFSAAIALPAQAALADQINVTVTPSPVPAGSSVTVKAVAVNSSGKTDTSYNAGATWSDLSGGLSPTAPANFVNGVSSTTTQFSTAYKNDTVTVSSGGTSGTSKAFNVYGPLNHFALAMSGTRTAGTPFTLTVTAQDSLNQTVANYSGSGTWSDLSGALTPSGPAKFTKGVSKTTNADITVPWHGDTITVASGGVSTTGASFNVLGPPDHIAVTVPNMVSATRYFNVTATMEDAADNVLTSYTGPASWSDLSGSLIPGTSGSFVKGTIQTTKAQVTKAVNPDQITVRSGSIQGTSQPFDMPIIVSSAEYGPLGGSLTFSGNGWPASTTIWMGVIDEDTGNTVQFCTLHADASGNVASTPCTISRSLNYTDSYRLGAFKSNYLISWQDNTPFVVLNPAATWSAASAYPGAGLTVSGTAFAPKSSLTVALINSADQSTTLSTSPASPATDSSGDFNPISFSIPSSTAPGSYTVSVTDGAGDSQTEPLTVLTPPSITTSAETGAPTQTITLSGSNWDPNAQVNVSLHDATAGTNNPICTLTADPSGNLPSTGCTLPAVPAGDVYNLTASEPDNSAASWSDPNTFALQQLAVWSSGSATAGQNMTVYGYGFAANSPVTVNLIDSNNNSTTLQTGSQTDGTGSFGSISFTIPSSEPSGSYTLQVIDGSGYSQTEPLTIQ